MSLRLLEPSVRARLRSGVAISSISQCVQELVENSIDAGASCVAVHIDVSRFKIQVADNGSGVSFEDFKLLGERYATSKAHCLSDLERLCHYGYRGEALASTLDVSGTVEVSSRHRTSQQTYTKIFHNGKCVSVTLSQTPRPSVGTTVTIHDFFYNLPVRRGVISEALELERIQKAVQCAALINPSVSFTLRNDKTGQCIVQAPRTNSLLNRFAQLFGQERVRPMKENSVTSGEFCVKGHISTEGHPSKSLQFIFVNQRIVRRTQLHTAVNSLLANSLLTKRVPRRSKMDDKVEDQSGRTPSYPIFVLQLKCPPSQFDVTLEPSKTLIEFKDWDGVLETLRRLVMGFLVDNSLTLGPCITSNMVGGGEEEVANITASPIIAPESELDLALQESMGNARIQTSRVAKRYVTHSNPSSAVCSDRSEVGCTSDVTGCSANTSSGVVDHVFTARGGDDRHPVMDGGLGTLRFATTPSMDDTFQYSSKTTCTESSTATQVHSRGGSPAPPPMSLLCGPHHEGGDDRCPVAETNSPRGISQRLASIAREYTKGVPRTVTRLGASAGASAGDGASGGGSDKHKAGYTCDGDGERLMATTGTAGEHLSPVWVQRRDPLTQRMVYVHTISGNTSLTAPSQLTRNGAVCTGIVLGPRPILPRNGSAVAEGPALPGPRGSSCSPAVIAAAPHLTHSFTPFLPRDRLTRHVQPAPPPGGAPAPPSGGTPAPPPGGAPAPPPGGEPAPPPGVALASPPGVEPGSLQWLSQSKWRCGHHQDLDEVPSLSTVPLLLQNWENPAFGPSKERGVLGVGSAGTKGHARLQGVIGSFKFSKEMFQNLKVLGQVDEKFIACMMDYSRSGSHDLLVLIDQHAAHERVRVEALTAGLYITSGSEAVHGCMKQSMVRPPIVMDLQPSQKKLARHFRERLESVGVSLAFQGDNVLVSSIPSVLMEREVTEVTRGRPTVAVGIVQELITEYLEVLQNTSGGAATLPRVVSDVINSQACHGAIKFGDPLTLDECTSLIQLLSKCRLPFQCAHGRPSLVPLLDLNLLQRRLPLKVQLGGRHLLNTLHARMMKK